MRVRGQPGARQMAGAQGMLVEAPGTERQGCCARRVGGALRGSREELPRGLPLRRLTLGFSRGRALANGTVSRGCGPEGQVTGCLESLGCVDAPGRHPDRQQKGNPLR